LTLPEVLGYVDVFLFCEVDDACCEAWFCFVDYFDCCAVFLEHAVFKLLGGVAVKSIVEGGRVDLVEELAEGCDVVRFFLSLLWCVGGINERGGEEGEEEGGSDAADRIHGGDCWCRSRSIL
jgi:hypothetical protein